MRGNVEGGREGGVTSLNRYPEAIEPVSGLRGRLQTHLDRHRDPYPPRIINWIREESRNCNTFDIFDGNCFERKRGEEEEVSMRIWNARRLCLLEEERERRREEGGKENYSAESRPDVTVRVEATK